MLAGAEKVAEERERSGCLPQTVWRWFAGTFRGIQYEGEGGHEEDSFGFWCWHWVDVGRAGGEVGSWVAESRSVSREVVSGAVSCMRLGLAEFRLQIDGARS